MTEQEKLALCAKAEIFKALGHPTRLWIVESLVQGELCVCKFVEALNVDFSTISKHLSVLKQAGLVVDRKEGKQIYYSLKVPCILDFMGCINMVIQRKTINHSELLSTL